MSIDLHTHSNVSDGTDSPTELVWAAAKVLEVVGLCDHDTFSGLAEARSAAAAAGIELVPGVEVSAEVAGKTVHLLGFFCDETHAALLSELQSIRDARNQRVPRIIAALNDLGYPITHDDLIRAAPGTDAYGRPHVADALVAMGVVRNRNEAFDRFLVEGRPAYRKRYACELGKAIELIRDAGGVAVLAHPWGRGHASLFDEESLRHWVSDFGLAGLEVDHNDHKPAQREELRQIAKRLGVVITGSSDYHGTGKIAHDLGCNTTSREMYHRLQDLAG